MSTPPRSPPARKASRDLVKSSIWSISTCTPKSLEKTLSLLGASPPLAMIPPAYPPQRTIATLIGRLRRVPPPREALDVVPAGVDSGAVAGDAPKSSRETVPSARFSGATMPAIRPSTPYL